MKKNKKIYYLHLLQNVHFHGPQETVLLLHANIHIQCKNPRYFIFETETVACNVIAYCIVLSIF